MCKDLCAISEIKIVIDLQFIFQPSFFFGEKENGYFLFEQTHPRDKMNDELEKESATMRVSLVVSLCKGWKKTPQKEAHLHLYISSTKYTITEFSFLKKGWKVSFKQILQFCAKGSSFFMASSGQTSGIIVQLNGLVNGDGNFHFDFFVRAISC